MPDLFKHRFILLILLMPVLLLAQSVPVKMTIKTEKNATHSFKMSVQFQATSSITHGFALRVSKKERMFPEKITVNGKDLWLKNARSVPQSKNAVHWFFADSLLELRFAPQAIAAGSNLNLVLHLSERQPTKGNLTVSLLPLNTQPGKAEILNRLTMPLPQNPQ